MNWRKHFVEAATLIVAAAACAMVANAFASKERKLVVVPQSAPRPVVAAPQPTPEPITQPTTTTPTTATLSTTATTTTVNRPPATTPKKPAPTPPQPEKIFNPHPDKAYIEIHGDDVEALHKKGVLFLDARRTSVYEQGHITGARPFSVWESDIDEKVNKLFTERSDPRDQNLPIVIYCSGGDCEDSHMLAQKLWGIQFNNVYVYKDGFPDWQKRGLPIHTGSAP
ncbi:MAG TPA: rhodanese-like domain-containing protein [Thermoanaerobaculia bacterium]